MKKFLFLIVSLLFIGCGSNIVGTWRCVSHKGICDVKYDSNGKLYLVDGEEETLRGSWELHESNDTLYLTTDYRVPGMDEEATITEKITLDDDALCILGDRGQVYRYIRVN